MTGFKEHNVNLTSRNVTKNHKAKPVSQILSKKILKSCFIYLYFP